MWKPGPAGDQFLKGLVIAMAAPLASMGVTLGCFIRNLVLYPQESSTIGDDEILIPGSSLADLGVTLVLAAMALLWLVALVRFIQTDPRKPLTIVLAILAVAVFSASAWGNWRLAYPVCNAF